MDLLHGRALYAQSDGRKPFNRFSVFTPPESVEARAEKAVAHMQTVAALFRGMGKEIKL